MLTQLHPCPSKSHKFSWELGAFAAATITVSDAAETLVRPPGPPTAWGGWDQVKQSISGEPTCFLSTSCDGGLCNGGGISTGTAWAARWGEAITIEDKRWHKTLHFQETFYGKSLYKPALLSPADWTALLQGPHRQSCCLGREVSWAKNSPMASRQRMLLSEEEMCALMGIHAFCRQPTLILAQHQGRGLAGWKQHVQSKTMLTVRHVGTRALAASSRCYCCIPGRAGAPGRGALGLGRHWRGRSDHATLWGRPRSQLVAEYAFAARACKTPPWAPEATGLARPETHRTDPPHLSASSPMPKKWGRQPYS